MISTEWSLATKASYYKKYNILFLNKVTQKLNKKNNEKRKRSKFSRTVP